MARENLYDLPDGRRETPHPIASEVLTGHFVEEPGYDNWRPHGTRDWLLIYTAGGRGRVGPGRESEVGPGEIVLWRPGALHDYGTARGSESWELIWAHFLPRPHWLEWLTWPERAPGVLHLGLEFPIRERVHRSLLTMHERATSGFARREALALNALEEALLWCDSARPDTGFGRRDPKVARALEYLLAHLSEPITLAALAGHCGLSVSRLAHRFRAETGLTPLQFLERERIARARQLLERTARSVGAIAADVGFENPFYFSLRFKKQVGQSPREYRQER